MAGLKQGAQQKEDKQFIKIIGVPKHGVILLNALNLDNRGRKEIGLPPVTKLINGERTEVDKVFVRPATVPRTNSAGEKLRDENNKIIREEAGYDEVELEFYFKLRNPEKETGLVTSDKEETAEILKTLKDQVFMLSWVIRDTPFVSANGKNAQMADKNGVYRWTTSDWQPDNFDHASERPAYWGEAAFVEAFTDMLCVNRGDFKLDPEAINALLGEDYSLIESALSEVVDNASGGFPHYKGFKPLFAVIPTDRGGRQDIYKERFVTGRGNGAAIHNKIEDDASPVYTKGARKGKVKPADKIRTYNGVYNSKIDGVYLWQDIVADNPAKLGATVATQSAAFVDQGDDDDNGTAPF